MAKLGTGVNVQERCAAIHHLDPPWKPAEVEQRDGRGPRPGNRHDRDRSTPSAIEKSSRSCGLLW